MDPALRELLRNEPADRVVEAIIRLRRPHVELPGVRVVARFGSIATCRLPLASLPDVRARPDVVSLKAARPLGPEDRGGQGRAATASTRLDARVRAFERRPDRGEQPLGLDLARQPTGGPLTGAGVVVGVVDWGLDVDHPNFKHPDGSTRLIALWDQRSPRRPLSEAPQPYGYGIVHTRRHLDRALRSPDPFLALGYHPADAERDGGAHGTHVMDVAAGNGARGPTGVAPEADLVFVHLADRDTGGLANLGDSVRLLEAVDFIARTAGARPWVINLSIGRHGGPHDGTTLTELALDELLSAAPGRFVAQSGGNYHQARTHATGVVGPGQSMVLRFVTDPSDRTPNELEVWYGGADELAVRIDPPGTRGAPTVLLGGSADVVVAGRIAGRIYHRAQDPNNGDHHIDAFLYPWAPSGEWRVTLEGRRVNKGRFHAWLERDEACPRCQARFVQADASPSCTIGTIANGHLPLVVGAYDARSPVGRSAGRAAPARHVTSAASPISPRPASRSSRPARHRGGARAAPASWSARPAPAWRRRTWPGPSLCVWSTPAPGCAPPTSAGSCCRPPTRRRANTAARAAWAAAT